MVGHGIAVPLLINLTLASPIKCPEPQPIDWGSGPWRESTI